MPQVRLTTVPDGPACALLPMPNSYPNIRLEVVLLSTKHLWGHEVRRTHDGLHPSSKRKHMCIRLI